MLVDYRSSFLTQFLGRIFFKFLLDPFLPCLIGTNLTRTERGVRLRGVSPQVHSHVRAPRNTPLIARGGDKKVFL